MTPEQESEVIGMLADYKRVGKRMGEDYERVGWLWRGIATVAKWVIAFAGAVTAAAVAYKTVFKP